MLLYLLVLVAHSVPNKGSAGCSRYKGPEVQRYKTGGDTFHYLTTKFHDKQKSKDGKTFGELEFPELEFQDRHYGLTLPANYYSSEFVSDPKPLIIDLPGAQTNAYAEFREGGWRNVTKEHGVVWVVLEGMKDAIYTSKRDEKLMVKATEPNLDPWSLVWGLKGGQESVAQDNPELGTADCGIRTGISGLYESCRAMDAFEGDPELESDFPKFRCSWHSCADDTQWVTEMLDYIYEHICFDVTRVVLSGQSTGAMFTWQLGAKFQERFWALVPQDGLNFNSHKKNDEGTNAEFWPSKDKGWVPNVVNVHGVDDGIVPYRSLVSNAWFHTSVWESLAIYGKANECAATPLPEEATSSNYWVEELNKPDTHLITDECDRHNTENSCLGQVKWDENSGKKIHDCEWRDDELTISKCVQNGIAQYKRTNIPQEFKDMGRPMKKVNSERLTWVKDRKGGSIFSGYAAGTTMKYSCFEYDCAQNKRVVDCNFVGGHTFYNSNGDLAWDLIKNLDGIPLAKAQNAWKRSQAWLQGPTTGCEDTYTQPDTWQKCKAVAQAAGVPYTGGSGQSDQFDPKGCVYRIPDEDMYFNTHRTGATTRDDRSTVCTTGASLESTVSTPMHTLSHVREHAYEPAWYPREEKVTTSEDKTRLMPFVSFVFGFILVTAALRKCRKHDFSPDMHTEFAKDPCANEL